MAYAYDGPAGPAYLVTTSASWAPDATRVEGAITIHYLTLGGADDHIGFGDRGTGVHSSELHTGFLATLAGHSYLLSAKWRVYGPDSEGHGHDGTAVSTPRLVKVPKPEPVRRLTEEQKLRDAKHSQQAYLFAATSVAAGAAIALIGAPPLGVAVALAGGVALGVGLALHKLARDPIDPNFRAIAPPKIPPAPRVAPGEGLSADAAKAMNTLFATQVQEIGLSRAILTAFNRSQGAHVKKQTTWERKQMLAAGAYAGQLATAMLTEARLRAAVREALDDPATPDLSVSEEDAYAFQDSLIRKGLPAQVTSTLAKLGLTGADQKELRAQIMAVDPSLLVGSPLDDAKLLASLRTVAADLRAFAKKAARDPLHTGQ